jgi:hypothetical protein
VSKDFDDTEDMYHVQFEDELLGQDWLKLYATESLDVKYQWTDVADVVSEQQHLTAAQQIDLLAVFQENKKLFDGSPGIYPHKKVHMDIVPNAKPGDHIPCLAFILPPSKGVRPPHMFRGPPTTTRK